MQFLYCDNAAFTLLGTTFAVAGGLRALRSKVMPQGPLPPPAVGGPEVYTRLGERILGDEYTGTEQSYRWVLNLLELTLVALLGRIGWVALWRWENPNGHPSGVWVLDVFILFMFLIAALAVVRFEGYGEDYRKLGKAAGR